MLEIAMAPRIHWKGTKESNVISLMDALKQSVKGKGSARRAAAKSQAGRATSRRPAKKAHRSAARHRRAG
jgi:non-homologous end joining protein Ku